MNDHVGTNKELLKEISVLQQRIRELEQSESERKKMEEALRKSEERYRQLVENASDIVFTTDSAGRLAFVNPAMIRITGYQEEEIIGKQYTILIRPDMRDEAMKFFGRQFVKGIQNTYSEYPTLKKDGQEVWFGQNTQLICEDGNVTGFQVVARDITDRKRIENELRDSEERYRRIVEAATDAILLRSKDSIIYANPAALKLFRANHPEDLIGKRYLDLVHPDDLAISTERVKKTLDENWIAPPREHRLLALDGQVVHVESTGMPVKYRGEAHIFGIFRDITERKRMEEALHEDEQQLASIYSTVGDAIFHLVVEPAGQFRFVSVNQAFVKITGLSQEMVVGRTVNEVIPEPSLTMVLGKYRKAIEENTIVYWEETSDYPTGRLTGEVSIAPVFNAQHICNHLVGSVHNITERKQAEKKLHDTLESLRKAVGTTIQVMVSAVETRDPYTSGHQTRSANLARAIATEMGLPQDTIEGIRMAGSIHDIGKLSIPAEILSKPTKLSDIEFRLIQEHARQGYEILKDVESPWPLAEIVHQHHERMDGSGYPRNLKGDNILIEARILAVADVVEAMASHRPYRPGLGIDAALNEIEKNRGIFYDNDVADACLKLFRERGFQLEGARF